MGSKKEVTAMKENGKSIWRARALLSNEKRGGVELGETSFRVYYGQNGAAVPFMWESQPGTPKHPLSSHSNDHHHIDLIPPLTPPPQFHSSSSFSSSTSFRKTRRLKIFSNLFSSVVRRSSSHVIPSPVLSYSDGHSRSTSSSSSESVTFSSKNKRRFHRRSISVGSTPVTKKFPLFYDDDHENDDEEMGGSPNNNNNTSKVLCFGFKKQGCYSIKGI